MTGYGKAEGIVAEQRLVVEVRSLNSKQLDLNARIPYFLRDQEMAYRSAVAEACIRGKVDIFIQSENVKGQGAPVLNTTLMNQYAALLKNFVQEQNLTDADVLAAVLRMPEVLKSEETAFSEEQIKEYAFYCSKPLPIWATTASKKAMRFSMIFGKEYN